MIRDGVVIDSDGQVDEEATEAYAELQELIDDLRIRVTGQDEELDKYRRKVMALQADQYTKLTASKHYEPAMRVLRSWQTLCQPTAKELETDRLKLVISRFNGGETEERLLKAVLGYSRYPYLVNWQRVRSGSKAQWKAEAEFVFRNAKNVEAGIRLAELDDDYAQVFPESSEASLSDTGRMALQCIAFGWKVFPCFEGHKQPACKNGLLDATDDRERIVKYWTAYPLANLAIRTGRESNLIVLDVDSHKGGFESLRELEAKYGELPTTLSVVTPRGGSHFYFAHPGHEIRNSADLVKPGIDVRGDGGYVLCPPSQVEGRPYEADERIPPAPMPEWLVKGLLEYQVSQAGKGVGQWAQLIQRGVTAGARNAQILSLVGKLVASRMSAEQVAVVAHSLNSSHCRPPLQAREVDLIVQSCLKMQARNA